MKMGQSENCQYVYLDMVKLTAPDSRSALPLRRYWWNLKRDVWYISVLGIVEFTRRTMPFSLLGKLLLRGKWKRRANVSRHKKLDLKVGDRVEVRSAKEIFATLDRSGKLKGLRFTHEMTRFCGRRFRVFKKLDKIILEATGELRKIRTPTYLLNGVFCDGSDHGNCDRSCFCFWRDEWLKKVT